MLPDIDGIEVCRRLRKTLRRADPDAHRARRGRRQDHRARGRRRRLHDEAVQPARARRAGEVDPAPHRARAQASSRRRCSGTATSAIDAGRREVQVGEEEIQLAPKEFDLLWELLDHRGPRADARPAARARLGLHVRRRHADGRRPRAPAPPQARRGVSDRHGVGGRLQGRRPARGSRAPEPRRAVGSVPLPSLPAPGALPRRDRAVRARRDRVIAVQLFQDYAREQTLDELRREAAGLTLLYAEQATPGAARGRAAPFRRARGSSRRPATASSTSGIAFFPGQQFGLRPLDRERGRRRGSSSGQARSRSSSRRRARTGRSSRSRTRSGSAGDDRSARSSSRSRRRELSDALAHAGRAARDRVPRRPRSSRPRLAVVPLPADHAARARALARPRTRSPRAATTSSCRSVRAATRSPHLADRFRQMAQRLREAEELERNFLMSRLARAADAADRDPRPRRGAARGRGRGSRGGAALARRRRAETDAARAARRRRARPREARRASVHGAREEVDMAPAARPGLRGVRRRGPAARDRLPQRVVDRRR